MSKEYTVTIKETLEYQVTVNANSKKEAEQLVKEQYDKCEIVLSADDFTGVTFSARRAY